MQKAVAIIFSIPFFAACGSQGDGAAMADETSGARDKADCCSCTYDTVQVFPPTGKFQCSFAYPSGWEADYDPLENRVYVKGPRCEKRCEGSRMMSVQISTGPDNNWAIGEQEMQSSLATPGKGSCGGRDFNFYRNVDSTPDKQNARLVFHVGNKDDKVYDASAQLACPKPGDWQGLEKLLIDTFK